MRYADKANKINKAMVSFIYKINLSAAAKRGKYFNSCLQLIIDTAVKELGWEPVEATQFWRRFLDDTLAFRMDREIRAAAAALRVYQI